MPILSLDRILLELESRWWFFCCPRGSCSMGLHKFAWAHNSWMSPLSTSLNFFAFALVTGPIGSWTRSFEAVTWSPSKILLYSSSLTVRTTPPLLPAMGLETWGLLFFFKHFVFSHQKVLPQMGLSICQFCKVKINHFMLYYGRYR